MLDKSKLKYSDYNWDNQPTNYEELKIIDRYNGHVILLFINHIMNQWGFKKLKTFHRLEEMIRKDVPPHLNTKEIIFKWLTNNW